VAVEEREHIVGEVSRLDGDLWKSMLDLSEAARPGFVAVRRRYLERHRGLHIGLPCA